MTRLLSATFSLSAIALRQYQPRDGFCGAGEPSVMNVRWRKMLRVGFVAAGLAGLGFAFRTTWDRTAGSVLPPWQVAAGATS